MSYSVRDDNSTFGPQAAVEVLNGAGAPTISKFQTVELVGINGVDAGQLTTAHNYTVYIAPPNPSLAAGTLALGGSYQIVGGSIYVKTASTSGTLAIEVVPAGTADGSGTNVLSTATTSLAAGGTGVGGNSPASLTLNTNVDNLTIAPNGRINFTFGGTLTNLVDFSATLYIIRTS